MAKVYGELPHIATYPLLRASPAMAAGVTDRVWDMQDVAGLIAAQEAPVAERGPHKKKTA
jgi:hypothetical protein